MVFKKLLFIHIIKQHAHKKKTQWEKQWIELERERNLRRKEEIEQIKWKKIINILTVSFDFECNDIENG